MVVLVMMPAIMVVVTMLVVLVAMVMLVLMAIVTTMMASPLFELVYGRKARESGELGALEKKDVALAD
jgi:hypothetical protein